MACILNSQGPQVAVDAIPPSNGSMEDQSAGNLRDRTNASFGNSILVVSVDATVSQLLIAALDFIDERFGFEDAVVGEVVSDNDTVLAGKTLEVLFGTDGFGGGETHLVLDVNVSAGVAGRRRCICQRILDLCRMRLSRDHGDAIRSDPWRPFGRERGCSLTGHHQWWDWFQSNCHGCLWNVVWRKHMFHI